MRKEIKVMALALAMGLTGLTTSFAADDDRAVDLEIKLAEERLEDAEKRYKAVREVFDQLRNKSKDAKLIPSYDATNNELIRAGEALNKLVANKIPSLEASMISVYYTNGYKDGKHYIREKNTEDLFKFLKDDFKLKEGASEAEFDRLLTDYVNAIANSVAFPEYKTAFNSMYDQLLKERENVDRAKVSLSLARARKNRDKIGKLEEAIKNAEKELDSAKFLIKNAPNTIKPVRSKLDALIDRQEKIIRNAKNILSSLS